MDMSFTEIEQALDAEARKSEAGALELAVILPTYNERKNVASMVERGSGFQLAEGMRFDDEWLNQQH